MNKLSHQWRSALTGLETHGVKGALRSVVWDDHKTRDALRQMFFCGVGYWEPVPGSDPARVRITTAGIEALEE